MMAPIAPSAKRKIHPTRRREHAPTSGTASSTNSRLPKPSTDIGAIVRRMPHKLLRQGKKFAMRHTRCRGQALNRGGAAEPGRLHAAL